MLFTWIYRGSKMLVVLGVIGFLGHKAYFAERSKVIVYVTAPAPKPPAVTSAPAPQQKLPPVDASALIDVRRNNKGVITDLVPLFINQPRSIKLMCKVGGDTPNHLKLYFMQHYGADEEDQVIEVVLTPVTVIYEPPSTPLLAKSD